MTRKVVASTGALAGFKLWTPVDDQLLTEAYIAKGIKGAMRALPKRSKTALLHRAQRLGIQRRRRWTAEDDQHLTALWGTASLGWIARHLKRTAITTYWRAQKLELPLGCPRGHEYLYAAAKRTGYTTSQLREVLQAGGVRLWLAMARPTGARRHFHTVDPLDVDDAVAKWHQSEVVNCAAEARGILGETLRVWLVEAIAAGVAMPAPPKRPKGRWRVPTTTIDSVIAWRSARESLSAASARTGVARGRLAALIRAAGIPTGRARPWLLEKAAIDRLVGELRGSEAA